jgi:predicted ATPase
MIPRLPDRFAILQRVGGRGGSPRQQTLHAAIDWSYELLEPAEQLLFRRLAVFAGLFDLAGATAMGGPDRLDVLGRLIDKSLVMSQTTERGTCYRLLDTFRDYAWERLQKRGEVEAARQGHLHYFLERAKSLFKPSDSVDGPTRELDDLRSAFEWCLAADPQAGLLLIGVTRDVWWRRSFAEGRRWARVFLQRCPEPTLARAQALDTLALVEVLVAGEETLPTLIPLVLLVGAGPQAEHCDLIDAVAHPEESKSMQARLPSSWRCVPPPSRSP